MKYCPYCGVVLADGAAPFCAECGNALPEKSQTGRQKEASPHTQPEKAQKVSKQERKRRRKPPLTEMKRAVPADTQVDPDDGYDGYYEDIPTEDNGHVREGLDRGLIKRIVILGGVVVVIIALAVLAMYFL